MNVLAVASGCGTMEREFLHLQYCNNHYSDYLGLKDKKSLFDSQRKKDIYLSLLTSRLVLGLGQWILRPFTRSSNDRFVKLNFNLCLVPRLRMRGDNSTPPHASMWCTVTTSAFTFFYILKLIYETTVEPGYNDTGSCETSSITSHILWYQLIPLC
jgi:hypothetical protein